MMANLLSVVTDACGAPLNQRVSLSCLLPGFDLAANVLTGPLWVDR